MAESQAVKKQRKPFTEEYLIGLLAAIFTLMFPFLIFWILGLCLLIILVGRVVRKRRQADRTAA